MKNILNIQNPNKLNFKGFGKEETLLEKVEKAFQEGVYADTPYNRKLGRVGMSYKEVREKAKKEQEAQTRLEASCKKGDKVTCKKYNGDIIEAEYVKHYDDGSHVVQSDGKQIHILKGSIINRVSHKGEMTKQKIAAIKEHKKIKELENEIFYDEEYTIPQLMNQMEDFQNSMEEYIMDKVNLGKDQDTAANEWSEEYQKIEDEKVKLQEDIVKKKEQIKDFYKKNGKFGLKSEYGYDEE